MDGVHGMNGNRFVHSIINIKIIIQHVYGRLILNRVPVSPISFISNSPGGW